MGVSASFDWPTFLLTFPTAAAAMNEVSAQTYWNMATTYHANDGTGPVNDVGVQGVLLNLLTAHLVTLFSPDQDGNPPSPVVGRVSSFSEGSVGGSAEYLVNNPAAAWYVQTAFGAAYWEATAQFRTARYFPQHQRRFYHGEG